MMEGLDMKKHLETFLLRFPSWRLLTTDGVNVGLFRLLKGTDGMEYQLGMNATDGIYLMGEREEKLISFRDGRLVIDRNAFGLFRNDQVVYLTDTYLHFREMGTPVVS